MNFPWLEYEKWCITSWYTVKPDFCRIFRKKPDSGSEKPDTRSRNLFVLKHIWVKMSIIWEFQPNWSNNTLKSGFFRFFGKTGSWIRNFFGLKPSRDQDGANKKKFSQIGPAVPEEIEDKQTYKHANIVLLYIKGYMKILSIK